MHVHIAKGRTFDMGIKADIADFMEHQDFWKIKKRFTI